MANRRIWIQTNPIGLYSVSKCETDICDMCAEFGVHPVFRAASGKPVQVILDRTSRTTRLNQA